MLHSFCKKNYENALAFHLKQKIITLKKINQILQTQVFLIKEMQCLKIFLNQKKYSNTISKCEKPVY